MKSRRWLYAAAVLSCAAWGCQSGREVISPVPLDDRPQAWMEELPRYTPPTAAIGGSATPFDVRGANQAVRQAAYDWNPNSPVPEVPLDESALPEPLNVHASTLTLENLEEMALSRNPSLAEAQALVDAARGQWVQAGLPPNPRMGYLADEMGDQGSSGQHGGFVAQQFILGGKLRLNREVAAWQVQRAEQDLATFQFRVLTDVRVAYYDVLIAQQRRDLAGDLVRISQQAVTSAEALFRGEEVSEADPLRARVEAEGAQIIFENAGNQHLEAWRRLAAVVGVPDMPLQRLVGEIDASQWDLSWDAALQEVLDQSPEMAAAVADVEQARWSVKSAAAQAIPDVSVRALVQEDTATGSTLTGVELDLPIPIINRNQGGVRRAQAQVVAANRAVDRVTLDLQTRLAAVFRRYQNARNQVDRYSQPGGIIENAQRTLQLIRAGYEAEEFGVLDLLTAQRIYFQARLTYLDSLGQLCAAVMEIRGLTLSGSLARN